MLIQMNWSRAKIILRKGAPLGLLVLTTLVFWRWCILNKFVIPGPDIYTTDLYSQFYPKFIYGSQRLASGDVPLWNPHEFCGAPFQANIYTEIFYPFKYFLFSIFPPCAAMRTFTALHILLTGVFAYLFFRSVGVSKTGASVAALAWESSVPIMFEAVYDTTRLATLSWLPFNLLCLHALMTKASLVWGVLLAIGMALQFLAGYPPVLIPSVTSIFIYYLVLSFSLWVFSDETGRKRLYRANLLLVCSACLCFALVAVQFLPFCVLLQESHRSGGIINMSRFPAKFLNPISIASLHGQPKPNPLFMGCGMFLICLLGAIMTKNRVKPFLFIGGIFAVLMSLGPSTPVWPFMHKFPPFKYNRYSFMWYYLLWLYIGGFAGLGLDYLKQACVRSHGFRGNGQPKLWRNDRIVLLLLLVFYAVFFAVVDTDLLEAAFLAVTLSLVVCLRFIGHRLFREVAAISLVGVMVLIYMKMVIPTGKFIGFPTRTIGELATPSKNSHLVEAYKHIYPGRIYSHDLLWDSEHLFADLYLVNGYDRALNIGRMKRTIEFYGYAKKLGADWNRFVTNPLFLNLMGAQLVFVPPDRLKLFGAAKDDESLLVDDSGYYGIKNEGALPRCFLVHDACVLDSGDEVFRKLANNDVDPSRVVLLEESLPRDAILQKPEHAEAPPRIILEKPEEVIIEAHPQSGAFLVLGDSYYPGWKAYDNGVETHIYRANYLFRAVHLSPGPHEIRFSYEPASFTWGARISIGGLIVTCACFTYLAGQRLRGRTAKAA
ncbi:MAG: hypothetical protein Kow0099_26120 [Candidatus Abyssubacteria bacterium]